MRFTSEKKNRVAFEREALPHLDALFGVGMRLTRNERDAEDLVQDTYLRGLRFWSRFQQGTNCKAWLFKILHNTFVNKYRRRVREREICGTLEAAEGAGSTYSQEAIDASHDPERRLLEGVATAPPGSFWGGFSDDVRRALDAVPEEFRTAVVLCDLEEFSYREIADIMECPVGTVMSRLHRGRRLLQAELREYAAAQGIGGEQKAHAPARDAISSTENGPLSTEKPAMAAAGGDEGGGASNVISIRRGEAGERR